MLSITTIFGILAKNGQKNGFALRSGATEAELYATEMEIGCRFPTEIRQAYLLHNGQESWGKPFLGMGRWLSLEEVRTLNKTFKRDGIVNKTWVPISCDHCGNHACVELNPIRSDTYGWIFAVWQGSPKALTLSTSLGAHLIEQLECLGIDIPLQILFPEHWQDFEPQAANQLNIFRQIA
ncbi:MAG: SMI1/KNR4 family protein [Deinococcaceae bacterium]